MITSRILLWTATLVAEMLLENVSLEVTMNENEEQPEGLAAAITDMAIRLRMSTH